MNIYKQVLTVHLARIPKSVELYKASPDFSPLGDFKVYGLLFFITSFVVLGIILTGFI